MIPLKNRITISNVVVSSILGHSGRGMFPLTLKWGYRKFVKTVLKTKTTVITKSATRFEKRGFLACLRVRKLPNKGMLNAYGLANEGVEVCAKKILRSTEKGFQVIPSYFPEFSKGLDMAIKEIREAIEIYQSTLRNYFFALEINVSCLNAGEDISKNMNQVIVLIEAIRVAHPKLVLIVKLSHVHDFKLAEELERIGVDIIHGINTIPHDVIFTDKKSPFHKLGGGGVSGGPAYSDAFRYNTELAKRVSIPLISGCGITGMTSLRNYREIRDGGSSVSICTLVRRSTRKAIMALEIHN